MQYQLVLETNQSILNQRITTLLEAGYLFRGELLILPPTRTTAVFVFIQEMIKEDKAVPPQPDKAVPTVTSTEGIKALFRDELITLSQKVEAEVNRRYRKPQPDKVTETILISQIDFHYMTSTVLEDMIQRAKAELDRRGHKLDR